jgi:hypothetical protein
VSDQRISISRVLAINWYGFRQILDISNHTLIAGAFGTGKTALLDLMQYVLLGEHWRPNRAAAGNARSRSLVSYCLCDTNTVRDGEPHYTRSSGVSVIGLEFTWPAERSQTEPRRETWGLRIEYSGPTAEPKRTYFLIPNRVEWSTLAPAGKMIEEDAFRTWVRREYEIGSGQKCLFSRQIDYLAEMATPRHLYFDLEPFQRTLAKAIAFEPEESMEDFIRRFILEESPLDVRDVKAAQDAYRDTELRLQKQEEEAAYLRRICEYNAALETARREELIQAHLRNALTHAQVSERLDNHRAALARLRAEFADDQKALDAAVKELEQVRKVIEAVRLEASRDPDQVKLDDLKRRKDELHEEIGSLREAARAVHERLTERHYRWSQWLRHGAALKLAGLPETLVVDPVLLESLQNSADDARLAALQKLAARFHELFRAVESLVGPLRNELDSAEKRLRQLAADLDSLGQKRMPGSFPVFEAIQAKLNGRAEQLGRLIEVRPQAEPWWPALELFLGRNRWAIIVSRTDYPEALEVLRRTAPGRDQESLVNPSEAASPKLRTEVRANSLATKVEVANEAARAFVHHLLGEVLCVETVEELDRCEAGRAITPEGVFKQVPTRRRLKPAGEVALTLGREGIQRMRQAFERDQVVTRAERDAAKQRLDDIHAWLDSGQKGGLGDPALPDRSAELPRLPRLQNEFGVVSETIQLLTTPEREARLIKLAEQEKRKAQLDGDIAVFKDRQTNFNLRAKPHEEGIVSAREALESAELTLNESRVRLPQGILDPDLADRLKAVLKESAKWEERLAAVLQREAQARETAGKARSSRNNERLALSTARDAQGNVRHPEYQTGSDFPLEDDNNDAWAGRLKLLETVELEKSRGLAAERRRDWERRLQEGVLDRLNEKVQDADRTIRQLRQYLDRRVGHHIYRISQRRDPAYAALWHLLDTGLAPSDPLVQGIKSDEIERAKRELMAAVEAAEKADEKARRLLDYRYYHRYDLEMVDAEHPDSPPISLGRSGRSLSGGENQAPFFISMLAAFRRVYDLGSSRSQHLGLVVMDEAFSKLSGDGVEDCLDLARNFQLQLVIAFPIDRLGVMAPYADTVVVCRKEEQRGADGYVTRVDNIPIVLPPEQVREALE